MKSCYCNAFDNIESGIHLDVVYTGFQKAFDRVSGFNFAFEIDDVVANVVANVVAAVAAL